jgi:hypothetical protein
MTKEELLKIIQNNGFSTGGALYSIVMRDDYKQIMLIASMTQNLTPYDIIIPHLKNYCRLQKLSHSCFND